MFAQRFNIQQYLLQGNQQGLVNSFVIYWPSTKPSIKRFTCVNKRKNSGSSWTLNTYITRAQTVWVSWRQDAELRASGRQRALAPQWPTVEQPKMRKKYCLVNIAVCPRLQLISHTQPTSTLSRINCEKYIFIKKCARSFIEVRPYCWLCSAYICICIMSMQHISQNMVSMTFLTYPCAWTFSLPESQFVCNQCTVILTQAHSGRLIFRHFFSNILPRTYHTFFNKFHIVSTSQLPNMWGILYLINHHLELHHEKCSCQIKIILLRTYFKTCRIYVYGKKNVFFYIHISVLQLSIL